MDPRRLELQTVLETLVGNGVKVYFQPPSNLTIQYPCVVYHRYQMDTKFADNNPYSLVKKYQVTAIDRDPDSAIPDKLATLPQCLYVRGFDADGLNHDVFVLNF
jgi:hypothetical protein